MRTLPTLLIASVAFTVTACGVPPELRPQEGAPVPRPSVPATSPGLPSGYLPPTEGADVPFPITAAAECLGHPTVAQVLAVLRAETGEPPADATVTVDVEPQCAGNWQYTVISIPDREALQIVTRGEPAALKLVTAGTDICTEQVRQLAPPGIRLVANC